MDDSTRDEERSRELMEIFGRQEAPREHPLPPLFDPSCKNCSETMERMPPVLCWTRQRPFALFQCKCKMRLLLFEAPVTPLLVWSDEIGRLLKFEDYFSRFIDQKIEEREKKRVRRALRQGEVYEYTGSPADDP